MLHLQRALLLALAVAVAVLLGGVSSSGGTGAIGPTSSGTRRLLQEPQALDSGHLIPGVRVWRWGHQRSLGVPLSCHWPTL
jgi:hypothetical protein